MFDWVTAQTWKQSPAQHVKGIRYCDNDDWIEVGDSCVIDPTVMFETGVILGQVCCLEEHVHLYRNVQLAQAVKIGKHSTLYACVYIGDNSQLGTYVTLYQDVKLGYKVKLGDGVVIQIGAVLNDFVYLDADVDISAYVQLDIGVTVYSHSCVRERAVLGQRVIVHVMSCVEKYAKLGDNVVIGPGCRVSGHHEVTPFYYMPQGGDWPIYVSDAKTQMVGIGCEVHKIDWWLDSGADIVRGKHQVEDTADIYDPALQFVAGLLK